MVFKSLDFTFSIYKFTDFLLDILYELSTFFLSFFFDSYFLLPPPLRKLLFI